MYLQLLRSGYILYRSYLCVLPAHSLYLLPCCLPGSFSLLLACLHNAVFCTFLPLFPLLSFENKISAQEIFYYSCTLSFSCQNKKKSGKRFFYYLLSNFILKLIKKKKQYLYTTSLSFHERAGIRTPDNLIKSQVLYHLSYTPSFPFARKMPRTGIEPVTRGFSILCSTD